MIEKRTLENPSEKLPEVIQRSLSAFAFFLAFPSLSIAGISITFFFFVYIILIQTKKRIPLISRDKSNKWFILLFIFGTISTIFHPPLDREVQFIFDFKIATQYLYWVVLAMYLRTNFQLIDWWRFSRAVFWASLL